MNVLQSTGVQFVANEASAAETSPHAATSRAATYTVQSPSVAENAQSSLPGSTLPGEADRADARVPVVVATAADGDDDALTWRAVGAVHAVTATARNAPAASHAANFTEYLVTSAADVP